MPSLLSTLGAKTTVLSYPRRRQLIACQGKHPYPNAMIAKRVIGRTIGSLEAYKCEFCRAWHIGNVIK